MLVELAVESLEDFRPDYSRGDVELLERPQAHKCHLLRTLGAAALFFHRATPTICLLISPRLKELGQRHMRWPFFIVAHGNCLLYFLSNARRLLS